MADFALVFSRNMQAHKFNIAIVQDSAAHNCYYNTIVQVDCSVGLTGVPALCVDNCIALAKTFDENVMFKLNAIIAFTTYQLCSTRDPQNV
jgi:hypothetical protein